MLLIIISGIQARYKLYPSNFPKPDMETILPMAEKDPRIVSAVMDDFVGEERMKVYTPEILRGYVDQLHNTLDRPLELWSVIYERDLDKPIMERVRTFDVTTFWVWYGTNLINQKEYIRRMREISGNGRMMLGVYMYDYGNKCILSDELMKRQLDLVGNKLAAGEVEGAILCSNCIADLGFSKFPVDNSSFFLYTATIRVNAFTVNHRKETRT